MMANEIFQRFGIGNVSLNINSLGDEESQKICFRIKEVSK